jgi:two-component system cell cycle sensor histidine kinase/response regulator CckA
MKRSQPDQSEDCNPDKKRPQGAQETLRVLNEFAVSLLRQNSLEDLLWSIAGNIGTLLGFQDAVIYLSENGKLFQRAAFGVKNPAEHQIHNSIIMRCGEGVVGRVAMTGEALLIGDTSLCEFYVSGDFPGRSEISVPVIYQGQVLGVLDAESERLDAYSSSDLRILTSVANIAAPRIASALEEEKRKLIERELQRSKDQLEMRVQERTAALVLSVHKLEDQIAERRRVEKDLVTERHLLQLTLQSVGDGLFATGLDGSILLASEAALRMTQNTHASCLGMPLSKAYTTYDASDEGLNTGKQSSVPTVSNVTVTRTSTKVLCNSKAEELVIDEVLSPIRASDGQPIGLVVVFRDVTRQRSLERKAQETQRLESLGMLAGGIAHDFNNVLAGILGRVNLAQAQAGLSSFSADALQGAVDGCLAARDLTKELLTFAKGGSPVKCVASVRDLMLHSARFCLHGSSVTARYDLDAELRSVELDTVQINQVFNNVILNAIQAMPEAGILTIVGFNDEEATGPRGQSMVVIRISDNGCGIPDSIVNQIFDLYFTTKSSHSGLGLASSFWIVKRHGGQLRLLETSEQGSTFEIRLPAAHVSADSEEEEFELRLEPSGPLNILLMDDESAVLSTVSSLLRHLGHRVSIAAHGQEAVAINRRAQESGDPFNLALLDLTIRGGMGGLSTLGHLRAASPELAVVVVSGYSDDSVIADPKAFGFDARLQKPFSLSQLRDVIASLDL